MRRIGFLVLFAESVGFCQMPVQQPDTIQALLVEVHLLRQEIAGMTVASQRVQIALYALQMQDVVVARATQRLDSARNKCLGAEGNRQHTATDVQRLESRLASGTIPEGEARDAKLRLAEAKGALEGQMAEVQSCQTAEAEASSQLRSDQAKLMELQDRIARLDKALEQLGPTGK
jgi:chromosome segregation ATPase